MNPQPAEPGVQTTEFWATTVAAALIATVNLATAFGLHISPEQQAAILAAIPAELGLLVGIYTLARGIRKRGTPG